MRITFKANIDDIRRQRLKIQNREGAAIGQPSAAFTGVEIEPALPLFVDDFVRVAGDDNVGAGDVRRLEPLDPVVHDDRAPAELDGQRAVNQVRQHGLEPLALAVIISIDAVEGDIQNIGGDEFRGEGCDVIACVKNRLDLQPLKQRHRAAECRQTIVCIRYDAHLHTHKPLERSGYVRWM